MTTIDGSAIVIPPLRLPGDGTSAQHRVDLSAYQGGFVRLYVSAAGAAEVNPGADSYWQVAEVSLPPVAYESVPGEPMARGAEIPLDLTTCGVVFFDLPA